MRRPILLILVVVLGVLGVSSLFVVSETEYAIKFQLGRIVRADYEPGIHFKLPFVNNVRKYERRLLTLDTNPEQMLTAEQKFVAVDSFVKWRIVDVSRFYTSTQGNEQVALSRLDSIVKDRIRNQIAARELVQVISEERVTIMQDIARAANEAAPTAAPPWAAPGGCRAAPAPRAAVGTARPARSLPPRRPAATPALRRADASGSRSAAWWSS